MRALILVDLQNDFAPGGALAVSRGDEVVAVANALAPRFDLVVATRDLHPADHGSFASQHPGTGVGAIVELDGLPQVAWPDHCVEGTRGADFIAGLTARIDRVFPKGTERHIDSYSGFFDNGHRKATGLGDFLKEKGVTEVVVLGLATDYCVKFTALDAVRLGFATKVVREGVRAVDIAPGDGERALAEMDAAGARVVSMDAI